MQHTEDNREQDNREQDTENSTHISPSQDSTQHSTQSSAHNFSTYSLDYYFEFAYIKNSDTIELYTILQDTI